MGHVSGFPTCPTQSSTTDYSQPSWAPQSKSATKKGDGKITHRDRLSRRSAALMFFALSLAVFAGDFLLLGRNKSIQLNFPWHEGWQTVLSWACSEVCTVDFVLFFMFALMLAYQLFYRTGNSGSNQNARSFTAVHAPGSRKREGLDSNQNAKQHNSNEGSTTACQREAGANSTSSVLVAKLNQTIDYAARQGDADKAGQLLLEFERAGAISGPKPDAVSFNLVIRAYAKKGDMRGSQRWLARMEDCGVKATVCSYNTILDACAKANNAEACETWLRHMLDKKVDANVISYATAIYARARRGEEQGAEKWLRAMIDAGITPDAVSYNSMIHACGVAGNAEGAERWIQEMQARGLETTVTTFTAVIDACAKSCDVPRAEKWLEAMIAARIQPNVVSFSSMIDACAKSCDPTRATYWHNRMVECNVQPNAYSYSAVINACAKAGDVGMAEDWLGKSEQAGVATDVVVYSSVIDACGKVGDAERAMAIFHRMQANGIRPHIVAYAALARPYAYRGDWVQVESIEQEMSQSGISKNEYFLYAQLIAYASARPKQAQRAELCFRDALTSGLKANDHVVGALARAVGRGRCTQLMGELCNGRSVPEPPQRRDGSGANSGSKNWRSRQP